MVVGQTQPNTTQLAGSDQGAISRTAVDAPIEEAVAPPSPSHSLRVFNKELTPIAGAVVTSRSTNQVLAHTDASGLAELTLEGEGEVPMPVFVTANGYCRVGIELRRHELDVVRLSPSRTLRGRVIAEGSGLPIANAVVLIWARGCDGCYPNEFITNASGEVAVNGLCDGEVQVRVRAPDYCLFFTGMTVTGELTAPIDFVLTPGQSLSGQVVDFVTRAPVAGARIFVTRTLVTTSRADGRFDLRLKSDPNLTASFRIEADGYCTLVRKASAIGWPDSPIEMPKPVMLQADVVGADGTPLSHVRVRLESYLPPPTAPVSDAWKRLVSAWTVEPPEHPPELATDDRGRFETATGKPWCSELIATVDAESGYALTRVGPLPGPSEAFAFTVQTVRLATARIEGRVLLNGSPTEGNVRWTAGKRFKAARANSDGRFLLEGITAGESGLSIARGDRYDESADLHTTHSLTLSAGQTLVQDFDTTVRILPISGLVMRADGTPVPHAPLRIIERISPPHLFGAFRRSAFADERGRFAVEVPACGSKYQISLLVQNPPSAKDIVPGTDNVLLVIGTGARRVLCRATDVENNGHLSRFDIYGRKPGERGYRLLASSFMMEPLSPEGWVERALPPGSWDLQARASLDGYAPSELNSVLISGADNERVEFPMERGSTLAITLSTAVKPWTASRSVFLLDRGALQAEFGAADFRPLPQSDTLLNADRRVMFGESNEAVVHGLRRGVYEFYDPSGTIAFDPPTVSVTGNEAAVVLSWR